MWEEVVEIRPWVPLITAYRIDGKTDYKFPSMSKQAVNSPRWTEFNEFIKEMAETLTKQNSKIENVPVNKNKTKRIDNIGGFTNFAIGHHVQRTENGGNI